MRITDRVLSVVLALALLVAGLAVTAETLHTLVGRSGYLIVPWPVVAAWGHEQVWRDPVTLAVGAGLALVGLVLLAAELRARRPALLVLEPRTSGVDCAVTRRGLDRAVATRAEDVDGVRRADARVGRRRVTVTATTALRDPGDLQTRVDTAVSDWVGRLGLVRTPTARVRLRKKAS